MTEDSIDFTASAPATVDDFRERLAAITTDLPRRLRQCADFIAAIWRDGEALIPDGNTILNVGDEIFAITLRARRMIVLRGKKRIAKGASLLLRP